MNRKNMTGLIGTLCMISSAQAEKAPLPNIVIILADDLGFSDVACYGSEIQTPNLDRLAANGLRYTQFYNAARCCPSRASLLTGVYPHEAGMGWMENSDSHAPAYRGDLGRDVCTIAEVLRTADYTTAMSGKWHVSGERNNRAGMKDNWPMQRGFDRFYGIISGGTHYFKPRAYCGNERLPEQDGRFFTDAISEEASRVIEKCPADRPVFLYLAYTAPHWPLHARESTIGKYKGKYDGGWDRLRESRLKKQIQTGLWESGITLSPRDEAAPAWDSLPEDQKKEYARRMEIYAAQVDEMDQGIGRVLDALTKTGRIDNTLILFLSDNGACAEFISGGTNTNLFGDLSTTWESYRLPWANAGSTPFREYKHWIHEGGIRTPLIVHWPKGIDSKLTNSFVRQPGHLVDIMATCVDVSGASYPEVFAGNKIKALRGTSLKAHFTGGSNSRGPMFWEHEANMGMRDGSWKIVAKTPPNEPFSTDRLELYNMDDDPCELNNLAGKYPELVQTLYGTWTAWGQDAGIFPLDSRDWNRRNRAMRRDVNSEFDYDLAGWRLINSNNLVRFSVDRSGVLSGSNSVCIEVQGTGSQTDDALLALNFPPERNLPLRLSFQAAVERETRLTVRIENCKRPDIKIADQTFVLGAERQTFSLETAPVETPGDYQLGFYLGSQPAGDKIWIDAITLSPE